MVAVILEIIVVLCKLWYFYLEAFYRSFFPHKHKNVREEIVLITGGGHGIGREMALRFGLLGSKVIIWDINKSGGDSTAEDINNCGGYARSYVCDVTNVNEVNRLADQVRADVGDITILINNAGILNGLDLMSLSNDQIRKCLDVNTLSHFWTVRAFLPWMKTHNRGHIINISSMAGISGTPYLVDYSASKFAVKGFTEALAAELDKLGFSKIKTTCVFPAFVNTGIAWHMVSRFIPIFEPHEAGDIIMDGILKEFKKVFVPTNLWTSDVLNAIIPQKARKPFTAFLGMYLEPHNKSKKSK